tara:strand:- start:206 stop:1747 length:1542 start_codon:yes stop_codon:yes gene_type:complete
MSEKSFSRLKKLLLSLKPQEKSLALKHLSAYDRHSRSGKTKMRNLCKVILKDSDIQYARAKQIVSSQTNLRSFNQLISRTFERVMESLLLDVNINRTSSYSKVFQKKFTLRKKIVESRIISSKGLIKESLEMNNILIKEAKRYELFDELLELLYLQQDKTVHLNGFKEYDRFGKEIEKYEKVRNLYQLARQTLNRYHLKVNFSASREGDIELMKTTMLQLQEYAEQSGSANVKSLAFLISMEYYAQLKEYKKNIEVGRQFLNLVKEEITVRTDQRIVYILGTLIENLILDFNLKGALEYIKQAERIKLSKQSKNYYKLLENKVKLSFYVGDYEEINQTIDKLDKTALSKNELQSTKIFYYKAMRYFAVEEFRQANLLLGNLPVLEKDKEGWNIWIRIMRILSSIELLRLELIDYDIASFKKYMQRTEQKYSLNNRDKTIVDILVSLDYNDFDFAKVKELKSKELSELSEKNGALSWRPLSPEMIIFQDWFESKLMDKRYKPNLERFETIKPTK